ncbi:MAG: hypothetical protein HZC29_04115 [Thaumarchaeota archaeon]|nr:hypothetical protein [Nitrososphaerota archaeon]
MSKQSVEKNEIIENLSKQQIAKAIKTAKNGTKSKTNNYTVSVCDIMKTNTSDVIKKMQSQMLLRMELLSDLYMKYLHSLDDLYATGYVTEKAFLDKIPIDNNTLQAWDNYWKTWKQLLFNQMDATSEFEKSYVNVRKSAIDFYDNYMHLWMESYAKSLEQINAFMDNNQKTK